MMGSANKAGICADAWFGDKDMIRAAKLLRMTSVLRMKLNKLKYRVGTGSNTQLLDAKELYQQAVRKKWAKVRDLSSKAVEMIVEVDLVMEKGKDKPSKYHPAKLLFVRGIVFKE